MTRPRVAIIILNWNGKSDTEECLQSLQRIGHDNYYILLVDNGSSDSSAAYFKEKYPGVRLIENGENLGYAEGNNVGARDVLEKGDADFILVLNNDTVVAPDFLDRLVDVALSDEKIGIVGPKIYYYDRRDVINSAGARMVWYFGLAENIGIGKRDDGSYDRRTDVDCLQGCALLIRVGLIKKIGLFDKSFFLMLEETDFCLRAHEAGYRVVFCPEATVYHKEGSARKKISLTGLYYNHRNRLLLMKKHYSRPRAAAAAIPMAARLVAAVVFYAARNDLPAASTVLRAYRDGLKILLRKETS